MEMKISMFCSLKPLMTCCKCFFQSRKPHQKSFIQRADLGPTLARSMGPRWESYKILYTSFLFFSCTFCSHQDHFTQWLPLPFGGPFGFALAQRRSTGGWRSLGRHGGRLLLGFSKWMASFKGAKQEASRTPKRHSFQRLF